MRNKALIYTVVLLVVLSVGAGIYLTREGMSSDNDLETKKSESEESNLPGDPINVGGDGVNEIKTEEDGKVLASDDFSISLPQGWEGRPAPMGASAMAINVNEEINDPAAQKINFQSYFAISYDTLQERSREEYIQYIKDSLTPISPEVNFTEEKQMTIGDKDAHAIEIEITQQGVDFKVLLILVWTDGEDVWTLSLNTIEGKWGEYKDLFYQTADNFQIKLK